MRGNAAPRTSSQMVSMSFLVLVLLVPLWVPPGQNVVAQMSRSPFEHKRVPQEYDVLTPSGAEIRSLLTMGRSSMALATLPIHGVSRAIYHKTVDDMWFFIRGHGEVWRKQGDREEVLQVGPNVALTIPQGTHFQYRNTGSEPLSWITATMPPWPGSDEVVFAEGPWPVK